MIELVVAIAVVSLVFVAIISAVTYSLRNSRYSKEKAVSVRLSQESLEWSRLLRSEYGWDYLFDVIKNDDANNDGRVVYCVQDLPNDRDEFIALSELDSLDNCLDISLDSVIYKRTLNFTLDETPPRSLQVHSRVLWDEHETVLQTVLREWK